MKKSKEEVEETRKLILDTAFDCFYDHGFKPTSLDMIAKNAGLTRGAIYWHFKDKHDLFREVFKETVSIGDIAEYAFSLPNDMSFRQKLYNVFDFAAEKDRKVSFIYKTTNIINTNHEFKDLDNDIKYLKMKLFRFFVEETRFSIRQYNIDTLKPEYYASTLFFLFEGLFFSKNLQLEIKTDKESVHQYINIVISDLIRAAHGTELASPMDQ